jgi:hypothetical protein
MIETTADRTTLPGNHMNKFAGVSLVDSKSMNPKANPINGHEQNIPDFADLQYACIFPKTAKVCTAGDAACDCSPDKMGTTDMLTTANSPLCQPPNGGPAGTSQAFAKAYPGARELTVLKDYGKNAIVASICPKISDKPNDPDYGYNPAVGAIIERLKEALKGKCLPRPLATDDTGQVLCKVIEAQNRPDCDCTVDGRGPTDPQLLVPVRAQLQASGNCGGTGQESCNNWCTCEILQETQANLAACQSNQGNIPAGYCYVDANAKNNPDVSVSAVDGALGKCPPTQQQLLRFVTGNNNVPTPAQGSVAFIACLGANVDGT